MSFTHGSSTSKVQSLFFSCLVGRSFFPPSWGFHFSPPLRLRDQRNEGYLKSQFVPAKTGGHGLHVLRYFGGSGCIPRTRVSSIFDHQPSKIWSLQSPFPSKQGSYYITYILQYADGCLCHGKGAVGYGCEWVWMA